VAPEASRAATAAAPRSPRLSRLARANWQKLAAGRSADAVHSEAVADADRVFALLRDGTEA